ncbi:MAG: hypothetical protein K6E33_03645 [Lachnospiraceae bacterium]|nr:hypothetical protein [Lachnospiraceae bacterium]
MNESKDWKKWFCSVVITIGVVLVLIVVAVVIVDPFFHFHKPIDGLSYILDDERYQNDGITRHFDYDCVITGTSETENFKASLVDELFGVKSVKVPFAGGFFKEVSEAEGRALEYNPDTEMVIRSIDQGFAIFDKDYWNENAPNPQFLYDNNILNDTDYFFNKKVLMVYLPQEMVRTAMGEAPDNFDDYARFAEDRPLGKDIVISHLPHYYPAPEQPSITDEQKKILTDNVEQNVLTNIRENPDVTFYYFYPPYSTANFYINYVVKGQFTAYIDTMRIMSDMMLDYDNVKLYCFFDEYDMVSDLDNYSDESHYSGDISDQILRWMAEDEHRLTEDNYNRYFDEIQEYYGNYDYESMYR